ncbi:MAG TPA: DUF1028 domain-containing protein, partial [Bacteroidetes bacterium]|nr:DUF1028 domain-containing protein [Bacteroidota bacterium]
QFGGVILISGLIPGRGAINGQATVCIPHVNLNLGMDQMAAGASPQEILDFLFQNDACQFGNETNRQYGVVDFDENGLPRTAAFTGSNALDYAGHRVGDTYAIQGNILSGAAILDSMEARFLAEDGPLAKKLMAAMQGANVPGADSRCLDEGTSSKSAFLRVARPDDPADNLYLEINIAEEPDGTEPINSLQAAFDAWADTALVNVAPLLTPPDMVTIFPNPAPGAFVLNFNGENKTDALASFFTTTGRLLKKVHIYNGINQIDLTDYLPRQLVLIKVEDENGEIIFYDKIKLTGQ